MRLRQPTRPAATTVEAAIVYPLVFLLLVGLLVGANGVYVWQQTAHLARVGARYAATHSTNWAKDSGKPAATSQEVYDQAVVKQAAGLDLSLLKCDVSYANANQPYTTAPDSSGNLVTKQNVVTVTISYRWTPIAYFTKGTLQSTASMPIAN
jgi:Flp pilus assembly protein TadG